MYKKTRYKILVTGSTGFIGNYVINELLKSKKRVIATSRRSKAEVSHGWLNNVEYIEADLGDEKDDWFNFFNKPNLLIHLAWEGLPNYKDSFHLEQNLPNHYSFIKNMVESGLKKVIVTGTCFEYGIQNGNLKENLMTKPNNAYALAKDKLRKSLEKMQKKIDYDLTWIRLFYTYGRKQNPNSILSLLDAAIERGDKVFNMSNGDQLRDYLPVDKVAEYIVKISLQNKVNSIINCCSGKPISIRKLVENYLSVEKKHIELNFGYYSQLDYEPIAFWGDTEKLNIVLSKSL